MMRYVNMNIWMSVLGALYVIILSAERVQSLIRAGKKKELYQDGLHKYMAGLCYASFAGTIMCLVLRIVLLSKITMHDSDLTGGLVFWNMVLNACIVGCILFSGMVHTPYSIPGIQFAAYGALIVQMILRVLLLTDRMDSMAEAVFLLLYVVAFSMAIPVVYPSKLENKRLFHIVEAAVSFVLVVLFSILYFAVYTADFKLVLHPAFLLCALAGDTAVLWLRRKEEVNWFVLVSLVLAVIFWIIARVVFH